MSNIPKLIIGLFIIVIGINMIFELNLFKYVIPILLILLGLRMLLDNNPKINQWQSPGQDKKIEKQLSEVVIFNSVNKKIQAKNFKNAEVVTVFGRSEYDLTEIETKEKNLAISLVTIFGESKIKIPQDWKVTTNGVAVFGAVNDNTQPKDSKTTVKLEGVSVFGAINFDN